MRSVYQSGAFLAHYRDVDPHPSLQDLQCYCDGTATGKATSEIEQHLVYCSECAFLVAQLVREQVRQLQQKRARVAATFE